MSDDLKIALPCYFDLINSYLIHCRDEDDVHLILLLLSVFRYHLIRRPFVAASLSFHGIDNAASVAVDVLFGSQRLQNWVNGQHERFEYL